MSIFWWKRTDAKFVEDIRKRLTGRSRKIRIAVVVGSVIFWGAATVYALSLFLQFAAAMSSLALDMGPSDDGSAEELISQMFLTVGVMGGAVVGLLYSTVQGIIATIFFIKDRKVRLLLRYYDVALEHGLIDEETGEVLEQENKGQGLAGV